MMGAGRKGRRVGVRCKGLLDPQVATNFGLASDRALSSRKEPPRLGRDTRPRCGPGVGRVPRDLVVVVIRLLLHLGVAHSKQAKHQHRLGRHADTCSPLPPTGSTSASGRYQDISHDNHSYFVTKSSRYLLTPTQCSGDSGAVRGGSTPENRFVVKAPLTIATNKLRMES